MRFSITLLIPILCCLACERFKNSRADSVAASSTQASIQPSPQQSAPAETDLLSPYYGIAGTDSAFGSWQVQPPDIPNAGDFFSGNSIRHPSGLLIIWFDTAVRATEDHPVGRAHADSIVVPDLRHLEQFAPFCDVNGKEPNGDVVGVIPETDTTIRPRLAWKLNARTFRIEPTPTDSLRCLYRYGDSDDVD